MAGASRPKKIRFQRSRSRGYQMRCRACVCRSIWLLRFYGSFESWVTRNGV